MKTDIAIIGGGVVGNMIARELSAYDVGIVVLEKNHDISMETTKANSGIVHAGYDAMPGSLKALLNVRGCALMEDVCAKLYVPYKKTGSIVIAFNEEEHEHIKALYDRGIANSVPNLEIINKARLREIEPEISPKAISALYAPDAGIVSPYELSDSAADCAANNGATYIRNFEVSSIEMKDDMFVISDGECFIEANIVINVAGTHSDDIANMVGDFSFKISPRPGEYALLDKAAGYIANTVIFTTPSKMGKGVLVAPTTHGNIIVGPSSYDADEKESYAIRKGQLPIIFEKAKESVPNLPVGQMITSFAGIRAHTEGDDFIIGSSKMNKNFINVAGIASPGLASSPAIAEYVADIVKEVYPKELKRKENYNPSIKRPIRINSMSFEEKQVAIAKNPDYARVICRCETVTEGEIKDAIHRPVGAVDIDGVKRRVRAGMGRCQGGFCGSKVMDILSKELDIPVNSVTKFGKNSKIIFERTK